MDTKSLAEIILPFLQEAPKDDPLSITELQSSVLFDVDENVSARQIKKAIEHLRDEDHFIVARRTRPYGYYMPRTIAEIDEGMAAYRKQVLTSLRILRRMRKSRKLLELAGQARLEAA